MSFEWFEWLTVGALAVWFVTEVLIPGALAIRDEIRRARKARR